jgi:hypothetical protein
MCQATTFGCRRLACVCLRWYKDSLVSRRTFQFVESLPEVWKSVRAAKELHRDRVAARK